MELDTRLAGTDALGALDDAHRAAWSAVDGALLEICRDRIGMLLRHRPTLAAMSDEHAPTPSGRVPSERLSAVQRAALDFTEQYIVDVTRLTDAQTERVRTHLGDAGLVDFVNALIVVEQRMTLELALDGVLGDRS